MLFPKAPILSLSSLQSILPCLCWLNLSSPEPKQILSKPPIGRQWIIYKRMKLWTMSINIPVFKPIKTKTL